MGRSTEEALDAHWAASNNADMLGIMAAYADDAILIVGGSTFVGKEAIQKLFESIFVASPEETLVSDRRVIEDDLAMVEWHAENDLGTTIPGVDTYIVRDGKIQRQTIWMMHLEKQA